MADLRDSRSVCARRQMSCVKLSSFCGKSSKRTGRQTRQDRASQHNGHRAEHGLHERCCARVRGVARVVRDMAAVESGVRRSRRCRAWSDPAPSPAGAAQSPAAAAAASERPKRAAGQGACTVVGSIVGATSNDRSYILLAPAAVALAGFSKKITGCDVTAYTASTASNTDARRH